MQSTNPYESTAIGSDETGSVAGPNSKKRKKRKRAKMVRVEVETRDARGEEEWYSYVVSDDEVPEDTGPVDFNFPGQYTAEACISHAYATKCSYGIRGAILGRWRR